VQAKELAEKQCVAPLLHIANRGLLAGWLLRQC
jgi:hypothetical protein